MKLYLVLFLLICVNIANADLSGEMNKFWNNLGGSSNSNSAYMNQSAGYYTGGSFNARSQIMQQRPLNVQIPKITSGCGGIDMFTGSFSHINLDQFVAQMKAIGSNAIGYAFQIGLEGLSPMIASTMSKLQETIDMINGININSCESAKLLVDGVAGRGISLKESTCAQMALISGSASDADAAKTRCKSSTAQVAEDNKQNDEEKVININYTWQALKVDGYVDILGRETAEAFMSMVGTIIFKNDLKPQFVKPMIFNENHTKALIDGGNIKIYKCDETDKCLNLAESEINISGDMAYKIKIKNLLQSIQDKIINTANGGNETLSDAEKVLIGQVSFPLLRIMVNIATGQSSISVDVLSEIISRKLLNAFFSNISSSLRSQLVSLKLKNNNEGALNILITNIAEINKYLENDKNNIDKDFKQVQDIIEINRQIDAEFATQFSGRVKLVLDFGNSLSNVGQ